MYVQALSTNSMSLVCIIAIPDTLLIGLYPEKGLIIAHLLTLMGWLSQIHDTQILFMEMIVMIS